MAVDEWRARGSNPVAPGIVDRYIVRRRLRADHPVAAIRKAQSTAPSAGPIRAKECRGSSRNRAWRRSFRRTCLKAAFADDQGTSRVGCPQRRPIAGNSTSRSAQRVIRPRPAGKSAPIPDPWRARRRRRARFFVASATCKRHTLGIPNSGPLTRARVGWAVMKLRCKDSGRTVGG